MKKTFALFAGCIIILAGCSKTSDTDTNVANLDDSPASVRKCASYEVLEEQLRSDPGLAERMRAIEAVITNEERHPTVGRLLAGGVIEIPVVVNILYRTSAENISTAQVQSQIDVMNADFAATNSDYNNTPSLWQSVRSGDTKIKFVLNSVVRKSTKKTSWSTNDAMKKSPAGINPTSPTTMLNLWCCNMGGGILGYAQFPGGSSATDGVVIDNNAFGNTGTAAAPYGLGRTATHEIGHWLNLRHIWGDATCGNDFVDDTPVAQSSNGGCPAFPTYGSCSTTVPMMTMNYMDYTYDACMYMFTAGQNARMQASFAVGGGRNSFAQP